MNRDHLLQEIYDIISNDPGIDTPELCLEVYRADVNDPDLSGETLANWLSEWHPELWTKTCDHVDQLIETGHIVFVDSGNLYPVGYQGDLV